MKRVFFSLALLLVLLFSALPGNAAEKMTRIAAGGNHTLALKSNGTLWAWGSNDHGQLGDGTINDRTSPVPIGSDSNWVAIAAGGAHSIALKSDGTLWAWGNNYNGQVGDGTYTDEYVPVRIGSDNNWTAIAAGYGHTLALKSDGTLWAWGDNSSGQLGDGNTSAKRNLPVQIGTDVKWVSIAAGGAHSVALRSSGTLWTWGDNSSGQIGNGTISQPKYSPLEIGTDNKWVSIAAGQSHTVGLKADGTLWSWGDNSHGQLGDGTTTQHRSPVQVGIDVTWVSIAAGWNHTLALKSDGTLLWAWGSNDHGQLGEGTATDEHFPVQIGANGNWITVVAGNSHTVALKADGTLWSWGGNQYGQVGDGATTDRYSPVQTGSDYGRISIAAGYAHTLALNSDGTLWSWGYNNCGQLGDGTTADKYSPVRIGSDSNWKAIAAGSSYSVALKSDGTLWSWGYNNSGQLGAALLPADICRFRSEPTMIGRQLRREGVIPWPLNRTGHYGPGAVTPTANWETAVLPIPTNIPLYGSARTRDGSLLRQEAIIALP